MANISHSIDELAERRRAAQLASLAEKATEPFLRDLEEAILRRMVNYGRAREPVSVDKLWIDVGMVTAVADLRMALKRTKKGVPE